MISNCDFCGRDTKNKSKICGSCMSGIRRHKQSRINNLTNGDRDVLRDYFSSLDDRGDSRDDDIAQEVRDALDDMLS